MLLNLYPTPIHKSAITNSLSKVCAGRCVDIQSAVRANRGGAPALNWPAAVPTTADSILCPPPTERHCGHFADSWNVWSGRLGSSPRGLDPQMARCRQHKKTVSWKISCSLKVANLSFKGILSIITPDKPLGMILERKGREIDKNRPYFVEKTNPVLKSLQFYIFMFFLN